MAGFVVRRGGVEVARIAAHHRQALRSTVSAPRAAESLAKACRVSVKSITPVLARLVAVGTLAREGTAFRVTNAGIVDLLHLSVKATLLGFRDGAASLRESQNQAFNRQPTAFMALAEWGLVTRGRGLSTITPRGRAVLAVMLADAAEAPVAHMAGVAQ